MSLNDVQAVQNKQQMCKKYHSFSQIIWQHKSNTKQLQRTGEIKKKRAANITVTGTAEGN